MPEAPYRTGDRVAFISIDPGGLRVQRTTVLSVETQGNGWSVETQAGTEHVNHRGEGAQLVPVDREMEALFEDRGSPFVVRSTHDEDSHEVHRREQDARELDRARERDRHRDAGR